MSRRVTGFGSGDWRSAEEEFSGSNESAIYTAITCFILFFGSVGVLKLLSWREIRIYKKYRSVMPKKVLASFDKLGIFYNATYEKILEKYKYYVKLYEYDTSLLYDDKNMLSKYLTFLQYKEAMTTIVNYFIVAFNGRENILPNSYITYKRAKEIKEYLDNYKK